MSMPTPLDVLIIGAGPVGLTAAAEFTRYGLHVRVVDRKSGPTTDTRAPVLWPRTQEVYAMMGLREQFVPHAISFRTMDLYLYRKHIATFPYDDNDSPYPRPLLLTQGLTETILKTHLEHIERPVEYGVEATSFEPDEAGFTVTLHHADGHEETVHASWLIGADGGLSAVRHTLGLDFAREELKGSQIRVADGHLRWTHPLGERGYFFIGENTYLGYNPLPPFPDGRSRGYCYMLTPDPDPSDRSTPTVEELQGVIRELSGDAGATLTDLQWTNRIRFKFGVVPTMRKGRAFLVGDAAKVVIPLGGQGMNTGIQDAFNLAWKIAYVHKGLATSELLDTFDIERRRVALELQDWIVRTIGFVRSPHPIKTFGVRTLAPLAFKLRAVEQYQAGQQTELKIHYPNSPLTEHHGKGALRAGRRAPDAAVVALPDRHDTRLFTLFTGTHWTLLLFAGTLEKANYGTSQWLASLAHAVERALPERVHTHVIHAGQAPHDVSDGIVDGEYEAHGRYRAKQPTLVLIRPDGYIGFRGELVDAPNLLAYLRRVFGANIAWTSSMQAGALKPTPSRSWQKGAAVLAGVSVLTWLITRVQRKGIRDG